MVALDFPLHGHFLQLFQEDTKVFPGQLSDTFPPVRPGSSLWPPLGGTCLDTSYRQASHAETGSSQGEGVAALLYSTPQIYLEGSAPPYGETHF